MTNKIDTHIITGFLGSGKTTLLNDILSQFTDEKNVIIENEFGKINVDSNLIHGNFESVFELTNGCICCSVNNQFLNVLSEIDQLTDKPNNLFIETTGIADAGELAANFQSLYIAESFDLKKIITVIDAQNVRLYKDDNPEIVKQIVAADILIINKTNLIEVEVIVEIKDFIKSINPYAVMFLSKDGHLDRKFLDAPNVDKTFTNSTIYKSENNHKIKTTLFETDKYFDIQKLRYELFKSLYLFYNQIYRIKGYVLNEKKEVFLVQSVGKSSTITLIENKEIEKSQLVFIGKNLELKSLERILKPAFAKKIKSDKILIS